MAEKTRHLKEALTNAQYQSIESIDRAVKYTTIETTYVRRELSHLETKLDVQGEEMNDTITSGFKEQAQQFIELKALVSDSMNAKQANADARIRSAAEAPQGDLAALFMNFVQDFLVDWKSKFNWVESGGKSESPGEAADIGISRG